MSHKQYLTWTAWLALQWNIQTVDQCYFAEIRADIQRLFAKHPDKVLARQLEFKERKVLVNQIGEEVDDLDEYPPDTEQVDTAPEERYDPVEEDEWAGPPVVKDVEATMAMIQQARWRLMLKGNKTVQNIKEPSARK